MASTLRNLLLKSALLTSTGIAALYAGSGSAATITSCTLGTLAACTGSNANFSISNVNYSGSGGFLVTSIPVQFTEGTGTTGPTLGFSLLGLGGNNILQRVGTFTFDVSVNQVSNPGLSITGYQGITTVIPPGSGQRGGTFDLTYDGDAIDSGSIYNAAALTANPSLSNSGPLDDNCPGPIGTCNSLPQIFSTVAIAIGYNYNGVGTSGNRPNSLSGVFTTDVPLPLPVVGAGFAFGFTRKLRQRAKLAS